MKLRVLRGVFYVALVLFVLLDVSHATWSPHVHPQRQQHPSIWQEQQYDHDHEDYLHGGDTWRGGSTTSLQPEYENHSLPQQQQGYDNVPLHQEEPFVPPKVHLKHVSMALRLTSEWNRRLSEGVNKMRNWGLGRRLAFPQPQLYHADVSEYVHVEYQKQPQHTTTIMHQTSSTTFGDLPVNVHPSRAWHPPISATSSNTQDEDYDADITVFHAKTPYHHKDARTATKPRGVSHWGPDLLEFLETAVSLLGLNTSSPQGGFEIPLAMIYMDRACSVETSRSNGVLACPFCTPRTVHRLSLASLFMAFEAVHSERNDKKYQQRIEEAFVMCEAQWDIPQEELLQMVDWMRAALGDQGQMVTMDQMKRWSQCWESIFSKNRT